MEFIGLLLPNTNIPSKKSVLEMRQLILKSQIHHVSVTCNKSPENLLAQTKFKRLNAKTSTFPQNFLPNVMFLRNCK